MTAKRPDTWQCRSCSYADALGCAGAECRHHPDYQGDEEVTQDDIDAALGLTAEDLCKLGSDA